MSALKKPAKAAARGKFRDLKPGKNPKGGATTPMNATQLSINPLNTGPTTIGSSAGSNGKGVIVGGFTIQKSPDQSSDSPSGGG
jgi:hypothetical protein